jgi:NADH-quinone oxidoreductase subunit G
LGSVGACRLCAVKKYAGTEDKKGHIVMSCMEEVVDGMIISVKDPEVKAFRASVLESLMISHPHDCPVCDEGGECHLQDMMVMTGHTYRRYAFKKQTFFNQDLGPFVNHEMNRCIQCYRCVRFYRNYAGGKDLNVYGSANHIYFGRQKDGVLENEFSGNLVEVCPTGVFTDKTLKNNYARKWDLTNAPSVCVHCSLGCNTILGTRYGSVRRVLSRYNGSVNGFFLCDRGRFGYEFINNPGRIRQVQFKSDKEKKTGESTLQSSLPWISTAVTSNKMIGIGSPRASLEANHALSVLVGKKNFYHGISGDDQNLVKKAIQILSSGIAHAPSLKEIENCDTILILGEDVTNTAPMIALAVRQAARNKYLEAALKLGIRKWNDAPVREMDQDLKSPVFIASTFSTGLDELAKETYNAPSEKIADFAYCRKFIDHYRSSQQK